jgi:hypothetical protein
VPPEPEAVAEPFASPQVVLFVELIVLDKMAGCVMVTLVVPIQPFTSLADTLKVLAAKPVKVGDGCHVLPPLMEN